MISDSAPLACPLDGQPLTGDSATWRCPANHSYDLARQGYLNLLPASFKPSKDPGDSKAMITARRGVLDSALFQTLADGLAEQVAGHLEPSVAGKPVVVDAGCGEGYFTEHLRQALANKAGGLPPEVIGVDISKWAITAAARRYPDINWIVGNNKRLPVLQGRADLITSFFGFETWQPWSALQQPGQQVMVAHAGPMHLIQLRKLIYDTVRIHGSANDTPALKAGYDLTSESSVTYVQQADSVELLLQVLNMTPHGFRIAAGKQADIQSLLQSLVGQPLTIDIAVRWYRLERVVVPEAVVTAPASAADDNAEPDTHTDTEQPAPFSPWPTR